MDQMIDSESRSATVARKGRKPRAADGTDTANRTSLYEEVTAKIISQLEEGRLPWVQPWDSAACAGPALPRNAVTGRTYSGVNILMLWGAVIANGWPSQGWLTFRQALHAGGNVRKGEQGTMVVYADRFVTDREKARVASEGGEAKAIPFLKRFTLFNVAQCEGLRPDLATDPLPLPEREIIPVAEDVIAASGIPFRIGGDKAYYVPSADYVQVPPQPAFYEQVNYYRTCLHELTHATGHPKRLARTFGTRFGTKDYAREELVAEMGSAFLCAALGIMPTVRHADYIGSWLAVLRDDMSDDPAIRGSTGPRGHAIFRAARQASEAAEWLLARHREAGEALCEGRLAA